MIILEESKTQNILNYILKLDFKKELRTFKKGDPVYLNINNGKLTKKKTNYSLYLTEYHSDFKKAQMDSIRICKNLVNEVYNLDNYSSRNNNQSMILRHKSIPMNLLSDSEAFNLLRSDPFTLSDYHQKYYLQNNILKSDSLKLKIILSSMENGVFYDGVLAYCLNNLSSKYIIENYNSDNSNGKILSSFKSLLVYKKVKKEVIKEKLQALFHHHISYIDARMIEYDGLDFVFKDFNPTINSSDISLIFYENDRLLSDFNSIKIKYVPANTKDETLFNIFYKLRKMNKESKLKLEKEYIQYFESTYSEKELNKKFANKFNKLKLNSW